MKNSLILAAVLVSGVAFATGTKHDTKAAAVPAACAKLAGEAQAKCVADEAAKTGTTTTATTATTAPATDKKATH